LLKLLLYLANVVAVEVSPVFDMFTRMAMASA